MDMKNGNHLKNAYLFRLKATAVYECSETGHKHVQFSIGDINDPFRPEYTTSSARREVMEEYLRQNGYQARVEEMGRSIIFEGENSNDAFLLYLAFA